MPLGACVSCPAMSDAPREYVAWGWAVNGFASVVGAVLATVLSMIYGFQVVLLLGLVAYLVALLAWQRLVRRAVPDACQPPEGRPQGPPRSRGTPGAGVTVTMCRHGHVAR